MMFKSIVTAAVLAAGASFSASAGITNLTAPSNYVPVRPPCQANIHNSVFVTGWDANGNITGELLSRATCTAFRVSHTYSKWDSIVWDAAGNVLTLMPYDNQPVKTYSPDVESLPFTPYPCLVYVMYEDAGGNQLVSAPACGGFPTGGWVSFLVTP